MDHFESPSSATPSNLGRVIIDGASGAWKAFFSTLPGTAITCQAPGAALVEITSGLSLQRIPAILFRQRNPIRGMISFSIYC